MNTISDNPSDEINYGETACGAGVLITPNTPFIHYSDEIVYFCDQNCKELYENEPLSSCMAARLLSGR